MPETEKETLRVEPNTIDNGDGANGGNNGNRFSTLIDLEKMVEAINSRDDDRMDE